MKATIFGAGNIGRGLVGVVLSGHYDLTFVDADVSLIEDLRAAGSYDVVDTAGERTTVSGGTYLLAQDPESVTAAVAESDLIATAVGAPILKIVAPTIAAGLAASSVEWVNVLACENIHPNSPLLREHVASHGPIRDNVGFPEVVVDRIVSSEPGSVELNVEPNYEFIADGQAWVGPHPAARLAIADAIEAYEKRKLWLVNGLHAASAYLGLAKGYTYVHEAMNDEQVHTVVADLADKMVAILADEYPSFPDGEFAKTARTSLVRFADADLADPVRRVGRNPVQKLGASERLVGPAIAAFERGVNVDSFAAAIAVALKLDDPEVPGSDELQAVVGEWQGWMTGQGVPAGLVAAIEQHMHEHTNQHMTKNGGDPTMVTENIVIANPSGLHARPASMLIELAKQFSSTVEIVKGEKKANAASIMSVLALGAATGDEVTVTVEGDDAAEAFAAVKELLLTVEEGH